MNNKTGFTMIELLITIAVIGALASIGLITFTGQQKSVRDAQRKSDLQQYRIALENYANAKSGYPDAEGTLAHINPCGTLSGFISGCPSNTFYAYYYSSDGTNTTNGTKYVLWTQLERSLNYWVVCSNGKSGELASVSISSGTCPSGL